MALLKLTGVFLMLFSLSYGFEICTKKALFSGDSTILTCTNKCCGFTVYTKYCCSTSLDDIKKNINNIGNDLKPISNIRSNVQITVTGYRLSTAAIIGIGVGSVTVFALIVGFVSWALCCRTASPRPGRVIVPGQPAVTVVSTGESNAYPGPTHYNAGFIYPQH